MRMNSFLSTIVGACAMLFLPLAGAVGASPVTQVQVPPAGPSAVELIKVMRIDEIIEVMRLEGLDYSAGMAAELFPDENAGNWAATVGQVYDGSKMRAQFEAAFAAQLTGAENDLPQIDAFFRADLGQKILTLEVEARRALMDEAVEESAQAQVEDMMAEAGSRFAALQQFAATNDLIEMNIMGAMNSNLAFFQGMAEENSMSEGMSEADILADIWGQEPNIRAETETWIYTYLALAYGPLSDEDFARYQSFSESAAGKKLNLALFGAFDTVFKGISRDLGQAAARIMMGEDI